MVRDMKDNKDIKEMTEILDWLKPFEVSESNGNFQRLIVQRIEESGKPIHEFKIAELHTLITSAKSYYLNVIAGEV